MARKKKDEDMKGPSYYRRKGSGHSFGPAKPKPNGKVKPKRPSQARPARPSTLKGDIARLLFRGSFGGTPY